jgi:hypothetical protein
MDVQQLIVRNKISSIMVFPWVNELIIFLKVECFYLQLNYLDV